MNLNSLVPESESIACQINCLELIKKSLTDSALKLEQQIGELIKIDKERKINYLISKGWRKFTFQSLDIAGAEVFCLAVDFLFKENISVPIEFEKTFFSHYLGAKNTVFFSSAKVDFKCDNFIAFEKWVISLSEHDYVVLGEKY